MSYGPRPLSDRPEAFHGRPQVDNLGNIDPISEITWYVENLRDVIARKPVRGLDEAEAGYVRALSQLRGAVDENRRLWARDHARGHRATSDCHVCVKFADAPALAMSHPAEMLRYREALSKVVLQTCNAQTQPDSTLRTSLDHAYKTARGALGG